MPASTTLATFMGVTLVMLVVPGPSVVYVLSRSIEQGRVAGLLSMLGLETGALLHVAIASVGLSAILASSNLAFTLVQYGGAAYLAHLGLRQLSSRPRGHTTTAAGRGSRLRLYCDGVLVDLLNPKTALFFLAFLPQFVDPSRGPVGFQIATLGLVFVAVAVLCDGCYALVAGSLGQRLRSSPQSQVGLTRAAGGVYLTLAGAVVLG